MSLQAASLYALVSVSGNERAMRELQGLSRQVDRSQHGLTILGRTSGGVGKGFGQMAGGIAKIAQTAGIVAVGLGVAATAVAANFQDAFAGVKKTVEGTPQQLDALNQALQRLSTRIPVSYTDLAGIAQEAGALNVAAADVDKFTEAVARTSAATVGLDTATTAEAFGKLGTIFKLSGGDYQKLGSALVELGRKGASSEVDIIAVAKRFAAAGSEAQLSAAQVLGWSSAIASLGPEAEAAGSSLSRIFNNVTKYIGTAGQAATKTGKALVDPLKVQAAQLAVESRTIALTKAQTKYGQSSVEARQAAVRLAQAQNTLATSKGGLIQVNTDAATERLAVFAKTSGLSVKQFKDLFAKDASGAIDLFLGKLGQLDRFQASAVLKGAGIINVRDINSVLLLAQHTEVLNKQLGIATTSYQEGNAVLTVSETRFDNLKAKVTELKNTALVGANAFGEQLLPAIGRVAARAKDFLLAHMGDFRRMGGEVAGAIDTIDWTRIETGIRGVADIARTALDVLKQVPPEVTIAFAGLVGIDKLAGGLLGKGAGNVVGSVLGQFFGRGSPANPMWVKSIDGLGPGGPMPPGAPAGGGGGAVVAAIGGLAVYTPDLYAYNMKRVAQAAADNATAAGDLVTAAKWQGQANATTADNLFGMGAAPTNPLADLSETASQLRNASRMVDDTATNSSEAASQLRNASHGLTTASDALQAAGRGLGSAFLRNMDLPAILAGIHARSAARYGGTGLGQSAVDATLARGLARNEAGILRSSESTAAKISDLTHLQRLAVSAKDWGVAHKIGHDIAGLRTQIRDQKLSVTPGTVTVTIDGKAVAQAIVQWNAPGWVRGI